MQSGGEGNTGSQVCKQAQSLVLRSWHLCCGTFLPHGSPPSLCWFSSVTCASPRLLTLQWVKASSLCLGRNGPLYTFCSVLDVPCLCVLGPLSPACLLGLFLSSGFKDFVLRGLFAEEGSWRSVVLWWSHSHPFYLPWHTWQRKLRWAVPLRP